MYTKKKNLYVVLFLLPAMILFLVNVVYPSISAIVYSLFKWNGISKPVFTGLQNYLDLLHDPVFYKAGLDTLYLVLGSGVVQVFLGLLLAVLLSNKIKGYKIFRTIYFFPVTISSVAVALMFSLIYNNEFGLLNSILREVGLGNYTRLWLADEKTAIFPAIVPQIWQFIGLMFVIILAGLQNIPDEIMECAYLDGATGWKKTVYVTIPLLWEIIQMCVVLGVTGALKSFDHINVLTAGGPMHATEIFGNYMYFLAFRQMTFGYALTVSFVIFVIGFIFTFIFKRFFSGETIQY